MPRLTRILFSQSVVRAYVDMDTFFFDPASSMCMKSIESKQQINSGRQIYLKEQSQENVGS